MAPDISPGAPPGGGGPPPGGGGRTPPPGRGPGGSPPRGGDSLSNVAHMLNRIVGHVGDVTEQLQQWQRLTQDVTESLNAAFGQDSPLHSVSGVIDRVTDSLRQLTQSISSGTGLRHQVVGIERDFRKIGRQIQRMDSYMKRIVASSRDFSRFMKDGANAAQRAASMGAPYRPEAAAEAVARTRAGKTAETQEGRRLSWRHIMRIPGEATTKQHIVGGIIGVLTGLLAAGGLGSLAGKIGTLGAIMSGGIGSTFMRIVGPYAAAAGAAGQALISWEDAKRHMQAFTMQTGAFIGLSNRGIQALGANINDLVYNLVGSTLMTVDEAREYVKSLAHAGAEYEDIIDNAGDLYRIQTMYNVSASTSQQILESWQATFTNLSNNVAKKLLEQVIAVGAALKDWTPEEYLQTVNQMLSTFKDLNVEATRLMSTFGALVENREYIGDAIGKIFGIRGLSKEGRVAFATSLLEGLRQTDPKFWLFAAMGLEMFGSERASRVFGADVPPSPSISDMLRLSERVPEAPSLFHIGFLASKLLEQTKGLPQRQKEIATLASILTESPLFEQLPMQQRLRFIEAMTNGSQPDVMDWLENAFETLKEIKEKTGAGDEVDKMDTLLKHAYETARNTRSVTRYVKVIMDQALLWSAQSRLFARAPREERMEIARSQVEAAIAESGELTTDRAVTILKRFFPHKSDKDLRAAIEERQRWLGLPLEQIVPDIALSRRLFSIADIKEQLSLYRRIVIDRSTIEWIASMFGKRTKGMTLEEVRHFLVDYIRFPAGRAASELVIRMLRHQGALGDQRVTNKELADAINTLLATKTDAFADRTAALSRVLQDLKQRGEEPHDVSSPENRPPTLMTLQETRKYLTRYLTDSEEIINSVMNRLRIQGALSDQLVSTDELVQAINTLITHTRNIAESSVETAKHSARTAAGVERMATPTPGSPPSTPPPGDVQ